MHDTIAVGFRLPASHVQVLDMLAAMKGVSRNAYLRATLEKAIDFDDLTPLAPLFFEERAQSSEHDGEAERA